MYYANYLKFMERARTEWLRHYGIEQDALRDRDGVLFAVSHVALDYRRPARFNDALQVSVETQACGGASMTFRQQVRLAGEPDETGVCCQGEVRIACLDAQTLKPCRIPRHVLTEIRSEH